MTGTTLARFGAAYALHRASEGRACSGDELLDLPYLRTGPIARQWAVRACSFDSFMTRLLRPFAARVGRPLDVLDLGAGNGWLSYRVAAEGHRAVALDIRDDRIDGLGAAEPLMARVPGRIETVVASFEAIPLERASMDLALFNASLHYALDLAAALGEAARVVRPGGLLVIMDTPFYRSDADGAAMVAEKHMLAAEWFGDRTKALLALPFIEYLTPERLRIASAPLGLAWERSRVRYPFWYEMRPFVAALKRKRPPSRFDLWSAVRP